ncbi:hypothetical protein [Shinella sp.]|uniref:hypothetical protein n=1 Tax=Shinella sp. TaxID=1870904 RepID=UPI0028A66AA9|nr:hypothetical protein [Shinella sp.]
MTALGRKAFVDAYQFNGQRYRKVLASPVLQQVAAARLEVINGKERLKEEHGPYADRVDTRKKHFMTVSDAIGQYWESHISGLSEKSQYAFVRFVAGSLRQQPRTISRRGENKRKAYSDFEQMFGSRSFKAIKPSDIEQFLKPVASPSKYNGALSRVSGLFNWAIRRPLMDMGNPCTPIRMRKVVRRRRDYSTEQIRKIATHIFYPLLEALPETDHLEGFVKRDAALVKAGVAMSIGSEC